ATALICDPDLVILDEPTTALDVTVEAEILDLLDELRRRRRLSMLFITHNLGLVNRICDTVCVLYAGSVLEYGPTADVLRRPAHPYAAGLLASMPRLDTAHRRARLAPIAGKFPDLTRLPSGCIFHPRCSYAEATCRDTEQTLVRIDARHEVRCWKSRATMSAGTAATSSQGGIARPSAGNARTALLDVRDLHKVYALGTRLAAARLPVPGTRASVPWLRLARRRVRALRGVSLSVSAGETLGLVGESGCGKSTLGRTIVRLLEPSSGSVRFEGRDIATADRRQLRSFRGLAQIVFQNPVSSLNPRKTVGATVGRALANFSPMPPTAARARVGEILEQVGLAASYAERFPHQLSGGERQRVGIARALATGPKFIVCDEPVSALDVSVQATVLNLLADLRDKLGLSYLFISHDLSVVAHIADRIAVMYAGVICEESRATMSAGTAATSSQGGIARPSAGNARTALLDVRDLHKVYALGTRLAAARLPVPGTRASVPWLRLARRRVRALRGVSLSVSAGETLGLVGESGCGKSTLGRTIVRLLEPSSGSVRFEGRDIATADRRQLRSFRGLAQIVFQNPVSSLNPRKTVGATVGRALANFSPMPPTAARARVGEILEQVGLAASYAERFPHQLSGGERQRVGIARALATGPKFIVCDEPVSALDVSVQATVLNLLADLRDKLGLSYLFISHDLSVVAHIADRIAVMYAGVICEEGPTAAILAPPYHP
ncbi:MAG: dipeptide ABC transporter ATP-binding protein, partial [Betaproteobacteria bacterium]